MCGCDVFPRLPHCHTSVERWVCLVLPPLFQVDDAVVMIDKATGASRGFGFVTFAEGSSVSACVRADQHIIDGQDVRTSRKGREIHTSVSSLCVFASFSICVWARLRCIRRLTLC